MNSTNYIEKFELYIVSLWLFFFLVIIVTADLQIMDPATYTYIGWSEIVKNNIIPCVAFVFLAAGVIYYLRFNYKISGSISIPVNISSVEDLNYEHLTFLTTYIIPLVCIDLASDRYLVVLLILLIVIGIIYVKTDKFYANPSLALLGFRLFTATVTRRTGEESRVVLITKNRLSEGSKIKFLALDDRVFYAKESK